jgi:hypothetical protein
MGDAGVLFFKASLVVNGCFYSIRFLLEETFYLGSRVRRSKT